jgi:oligosaccharide repeat unit polymerase
MQQNKDALNLVAFHLCICATLVFLWLLYPFLDIDLKLLIYLICLFFVALTIWSFWSWYKLTKNLFNPYILFFISAVVFNGGQAFLEVFHLNKDGILKSQFSPDTLLKTLFLISIGLATFHLGALLSATTTGKTSSPKLSSGKQTSLYRMQDSCRTIGWGLFALSFLPTVWVAKDAIVKVLGSGYLAIYQEIPTSFASTPILLSDFLVPSILFLLAGSKNKSKLRIFCIVIVFIYAAIRLFIGQRNTALMPLVALTWVWHRLIHPIPKTLVFAVIALFLFVIFPVIQLTRNTAGAERLSIDILVSAFSSVDNPLIESISEMGGSMQTVAYTIELVPKVKDFEMGLGYFYSILTLIPNFFWKVHPAAAHGLPSSWLIWEVDPLTASVNGTIGFSFIAEAYMNFGWLGTPIILGGIGFLFAKLVLWADRSEEPAKIALVASFLSFFLFYARAQAADIVRPLVWYSFIPYLGTLLLMKFRA